LDRLPTESPVRGLRLEVQPVPADSLPDQAVTRSVPLDAQGHELPPGTVPPEGGGYRIEVSDQAAAVHIPPASAHAVAEPGAIQERAANGLALPMPAIDAPIRQAPVREVVSLGTGADYGNEDVGLSSAGRSRDSGAGQVADSSHPGDGGPPPTRGDRT